ncbi:MAG TPA: lasso peptide biosynthesis B2 protein [Thermoanaerobaculia bacterium]|nr:lasso peptide biosynthesis B2 protein [Thermoanaerobaculia bacterium]
MLRELARCSGAERRMLARAAFLVPLVRVALWVVPFRVVHRAASRAVSRGRRAEGVSSPRVIWGVRAVAARVPAATCLTQALAASVLLSRYGHEFTLRVGVAKEGNALRAHAWLESGGQPILGAPAPGAFHPLPPLALS